MKNITLEYVIMACIFSMFIRDMVIEFKPKKKDKTQVESVQEKKEK